MELIFHIKTTDQLSSISDKFFKNISALYSEKPADIADKKNLLHPFHQLQYKNRIYLGNEFCFHRLPLVSDFISELKKIEKHDIKITLLSPPLTDSFLKKTIPLLDYLIRFAESEVVINDWGFLLFIRKHYPTLKISAGRLLNKAFKDPRFLQNTNDDFLASSTFDNVLFRKKMLKLGISRLEQDLLPHQNFENFTSDDLIKRSFYFPYGYITTGRVCLPSLLSKKTQTLKIPEKCSRPCHKRLFELKHDSFPFPLFQKGNTVFYLYPASMLAALIQKAKNENVRLVYQGFGL